jgi:hypothetical protein
MRMKLRARLLLSAAFLLAAPALAEPVKQIESARVTLRDLVESAPAELAGVDLGPAPPPGGSRLIARDELLREIRRAGADAKGLTLPELTRVVSAGKRFTPAELGRLFEPALRAALPRGVTLKSVTVARGALVSPRVEAGAVFLPKLPRRRGNVKSSGSVELVLDGAVVSRVPVAVWFSIEPVAAEPLVKRGSRIDLVIERGPARITAAAVALADAEIGDVVQFRVGATQKMLRARVESRSLARVVAP